MESSTMSNTGYEDIVINTKYRFGEFKVTKEDIVSFAQTWDPQPFHINEQKAKRSVFGQLTASSAQIYAICTKLAHNSPNKLAVMAGLGVEQMNFPHPVVVGDSLHMTSVCLEKRLSKTREGVGIVRTQAEIINQDGKVVMVLTANYMVATKRMLEAA